MSSADLEAISLRRRDVIAAALGAGLGTALSSTTSEAGPALRALGDLKGDVEEERSWRTFLHWNAMSTAFRSS